MKVAAALDTAAKTRLYRLMVMRWFVLVVLVLALSPGVRAQGPMRLAVASNFKETAAALVEAFEKESKADITISAGSTGSLYVQILQGAPFDVFLAADRIRPAGLKGVGKARETMTYARGQLVLWAPTAQQITNRQEAAAHLKSLGDKAIAVAHPKFAPYGNAAQQVMNNLKLRRVKALRGTNIGHTYALIATGNAKAGFIAASQLETDMPGAQWRVPDSLHGPIDQDAALLSDKPAAEHFFAFLKSAGAAAIIEANGYRLAPPGSGG